MPWPATAAELVAEQLRLASAQPPLWVPPAAPYAIAGCFVCSPRGKSGAGAGGDRCQAAAVLRTSTGDLFAAEACGPAGGPYESGLLALREGALLEEVVRHLPARPAVLLVNSTGRDHPRRAGMALHLGAVLDLPTVGVTHRPLAAGGTPPASRRGASSPLVLDGELVGHWVCTQDGARPLVVHAAWRTAAATARAVVIAATPLGVRTPAPIREARRLARLARAAADGFGGCTLAAPGCRQRGTRERR